MPFQYQWIAAKQFWHDDKKRQKRKCTECQVDFNWSTSTGNRLKHSLSHSSLEPAIRQGSMRIVGTAPSNPTPPTQSVIVIDSDSKEEKSDDRSTAPALAVLPKPKSQKNERQITSMLSRVAAGEDGEHGDPRVSAAVLFAQHSIPHLIIESSEWKQYVSDCRAAVTYKHISREQLVNTQASVALLTKSKVAAKLSENFESSSITLAIDGWSKRRTKYLNCLLLKAGRAFYWESFPNKYKKQDGIFIHSKLSPLIKELIDKQINVIAVVCDNESANGKALRLLMKDYDFLVHVPCAAHVIQLIVRDLLENEHAGSLLEGVKEIIQLFNGNKEYRLQLLNDQINSATTPRLFIIPCDTRWSSELAAIIRVLGLRRWLGKYVDKDPDFWTQLKELVSFLEPFALATDIVQSDSATLLDIYHQFRNLMIHCEKFESNEALDGAAKAAKTSLATRWVKQVNESAIISCALFSFVDKNQLIEQFGTAAVHQAKEYWLTIGSSYLFHYRMCSGPVEKLLQEVPPANEPMRTQKDVNTEKIGIIRDVLDTQWKEMLLGSGIWSSFRSTGTRQREIAAKKAEFLREKLKQEGSLKDDEAQHLFFDPRLIWADQLLTAAELAAVACAFLSIAASEASVERSFSAHALVIAKRRHNLSHPHASNELQIKFNRRTLESPKARIGFHSEMTQSSEHAAIKFGAIALAFIAEQEEEDETDSSSDESDQDQDEDTDSEEVAVPLTSSRAKPPNPRGSNSRSTKPVNQPISQSSRQSRAGTAQRKRGAEELDAHSNSEATSRATVKRSRNAGTFETDDVSVKERLYKLGEDYLGDRAKKNDAVYCQEKWNSEHYQLVLQAWLDDKQDKTQLKDFTAALRSLVAQRFPIQAADAALPAHDAEMNSHSGDQSSSVSH